MKKAQVFAVLGALATFNLFKRAIQSRNLKGKVVLITGGTKGLGFALLQHLLKEDCQIAICARTEEDLLEVKKHYPQVFVERCDVGKKEEAEELIRKTIQHFGRVDVLINNAGIIVVGPMESMRRGIYEETMDIMFWGILNTSFAVLPHMKAQGGGQIVNITSVGGKVSIPYLLPYSAAKFAAVGFSEGLANELRSSDIFVTTIIPGLMRTGSYVNAKFQRHNKAVFKIFSFISSTPFLTVSNDKAARRVILAMKAKRPVKVIGFQARALIELHHFFPNSLIRFFSLTASMAPSQGDEREYASGAEITRREEDAEVPGAELLGKEAQKKFQEQRLH